MGSFAGNPIYSTHKVMLQKAPPRTYAEWSDCFDALENGLDDAAVIAAMSNGTLSWTSGVASLFAERVSSVFNFRLRRCADQMDRELRQGTDEVTLVRALLNARRTLSGLFQIATISAFPSELSDHLSDELKKYATRAQQSLEDSAKQDRIGHYANLIRNNSLLRYETATPQVMSTNGASPQGVSVEQAPPGARRRNIIL